MALLLFATTFTRAGAAPTVAGPTYPPASGYLVDAADVLAPAVRVQIDGELASLHQRLGDQLAVAIVPTLGSTPIDTYAHDLFDRWGIGERGIDNGGLVLIAVRERTATVLLGSGLLGSGLGVTTGLAADVAQIMAPELRDGDFADAAIEGERRVRTLLGDTELADEVPAVAPPFADGQAPALPPAPPSPGPTVASVPAGIAAGLIAVVAVALAGVRRRRRSRRRLR